MMKRADPPRTDEHVENVLDKHKMAYTKDVLAARLSSSL